MLKNTILFIVLVLIVGSFAQATHIEQTENDGGRSFDWVVMHYLNGDNVLSAAQGVTLEELRVAGSTADVQVTVLIDQIGVSDTRLYYIVGNSLVQQPWEAESSMDDTQTLIDYVAQVKTDFAADHYSLILSSNKGTAWQGIIWDDHGDGVMITMPELGAALSQITNSGVDKLDIFGIETCMTGNLEVAYQIYPYVEFFVAYPECAIVGDWPFSEPLYDLFATPSMDPETLAVTMVSYFVPTNYPQYHMKTTMSVIDCSKVAVVAEKMDDLGELFMADLDAYRADIQSAIANTKVYALLWNINYFVDMYHFLSILLIADPTITAAQTAAKTAIDDMVVVVARLFGDDAYGINAYFPRVNTDYNSSLRYAVLPSSYEATDYAMDTCWDDFLKEFLGITNNTAPDTPSITGTTKGKPGVDYEYFVSTVDPEGFAVSYYVDWDDGSPADWQGPFNSSETVVFNHTFAAKGTYMVRVKARDGLGAESTWGTLQVKMPHTIGVITLNPWSFLLGKISDIERNAENDFRFLPQKVLYINYNQEQGFSVQIIDEFSGAFPCCGFIPDEDFYGKLRDSFIRGIWFIE